MTTETNYGRISLHDKTREGEQEMKKTTGFILCALFAALLAVGAWIKIPTPAVPVTLQTLLVLLSGMLLGAKRGAAACGVYLAVGLAGLPVFTKGGGILYLFEPTFGFLLGFPICAFVVGLVTEKKKQLPFWKLFLTGVFGLCIIYAVGILYFCLVKHLYFGESTEGTFLILSAVLLCLPIDFISCAVCALLTRRIKPMILKYV